MFLLKIRELEVLLSGLSWFIFIRPATVDICASILDDLSSQSGMESFIISSFCTSLLLKKYINFSEKHTLLFCDDSSVDQLRSHAQRTGSNKNDLIKCPKKSANFFFVLPRFCNAISLLSRSYSSVRSLLIFPDALRITITSRSRTEICTSRSSWPNRSFNWEIQLGKNRVAMGGGGANTNAN